MVKHLHTMIRVGRRVTECYHWLLIRRLCALTTSLLAAVGVEGGGGGRERRGGFFSFFLFFFFLLSLSITLSVFQCSSLPPSLPSLLSLPPSFLLPFILYVIVLQESDGRCRHDWCEGKVIFFFFFCLFFYFLFSFFFLLFFSSFLFSFIFFFFPSFHLFSYSFLLLFFFFSFFLVLFVLIFIFFFFIITIFFFFFISHILHRHYTYIYFLSSAFLSSLKSSSQTKFHFFFQFPQPLHHCLSLDA